MIMTTYHARHEHAKLAKEICKECVSMPAGPKIIFENIDIAIAMIGYMDIF